jgi:hypothetical protein
LQAHWKQLEAAYGAAGTAFVLDLSGAWEGETVASLAALREGLLLAVG